MNNVNEQNIFFSVHFLSLWMCPMDFLFTFSFASNPLSADIAVYRHTSSPTNRFLSFENLIEMKTQVFNHAKSLCLPLIMHTEWEINICLAEKEAHTHTIVFMRGVIVATCWANDVDNSTLTALRNQVISKVGQWMVSQTNEFFFFDI
jgi:hypothetical protein